jgi:phosphoribosylformylglycinamidine synthase
MPLADDDRRRVVSELGREPTRTEAALFENLWSEHCAYRSSRTLLSAFESDGDRVVVGPGDDAAVVAVDDDWCLTLGVESHNHPSYVDPYDGAATGVGGIVRDTLSMGAYPVALADCLYFGGFDRERSRYLLEGVVEGISDYANAIGVPTVDGSVAFHDGYEGNPLVNVACIGVLPRERLVTAAAERPGDRLVLVGNATGRDGLGGASFASEDLAEDATTEDRPAVQVGDPYAQKLLIEVNEELLDRNLVRAARDLGAAGLGGATAEMVAKADTGCVMNLEAVHTRETGMNATELLLAESQERMCYAVAPDDIDAVRAVAERYDLGCSVVGEVTDDGRYVCRFDDEAVVDVPATFVADGAPANDLVSLGPSVPTRAERDLPAPEADRAFEAVVGDPTVAGRRWIYRQYDHEVGLRTAVGPDDEAALLALHEAGADVGVALAAGANPNWTDAAPYDGARGVAVAAATALATVGAKPAAAVNCLNGGNPETPAVYGGFSTAVEGLADGCASLGVPVVGGNVSLYNDSAAGPVPPTPTLAMAGLSNDTDAPGAGLTGEGTLLLVGGHDDGLGGSTYLDRFGGRDRVPSAPEAPTDRLDALRRVVGRAETRAVAAVAGGGLASTLARMVTGDPRNPEVDREDGNVGATVTVPDAPALYSEAVGRAVVETTATDEVQAAFEEIAPVTELGTATLDGELTLSVGTDRLRYDAVDLAALRDVLGRELG